MLGINKGKMNGMWKGDFVSYKSLHAWIKRNKTPALRCERCGKQSRLDAANISGQYRRDVNDFEWLCRACHMTSDGRLSDLVVRNTERQRKSINGKYQCYSCKQFFALVDFSKDRTMLLGYSSYCKSCKNRKDKRTKKNQLLKV